MLIRSRVRYFSSFRHRTVCLCFQKFFNTISASRTKPSLEKLGHEFSSPSCFDVSKSLTTRLLPPLSRVVEVRRNLSVSEFTNMHPLTVKILVGTGVAVGYLGWDRLQRASWKQRQYIRRRLLKPSHFVHPPLSIVRRAEEKILRQFFASPPSGPSVVIGPEGAGKSSLLKKIFDNRPMILWLDLKQNPVTTGEEFLVSLITGCGYLLPTSGSMFSALLGLAGSRPQQGLVSNEDVDKALSTFIDVLRFEKDQGWTNGVPVIVLDDIHRLGSCNDLELRNSKLSDDPKFLKFMDWVRFSV